MTSAHVRAIDELHSKLVACNGLIGHGGFHPDVETGIAKGGPKWVLSENKQYQCSYCADQSEENIYIRCAHNRQGKFCSKYVHLDCGLNIESFYMDDNGNLTCECKNHYEPVTFCSCKKPYDENLPMIQCDRCLEWYHEQCEGVGKVNENDEYVCKSCRVLGSKGKTVSSDLKEANAAKDERYRFNIDGNAAAECLRRLVEDVCPVVDGVFRRSSNSGASLEEVITAIGTIQDCLPSSEEESKVAMVLKDDTFLQTWDRQLKDFQAAFHRWNTLAIEALETFFTNFSGKFSVADKELLIRVCAQYEDLELTRSNNFRFISVDVQGYLITYEIMQQISLFFSILYVDNDAPIDQQFRHLAISREGAWTKTLRLDKLGRELKNDPFAARHQYFSKFCKDAKTLINYMEQWYHDCHKLVNFEGHWTAEVFERLLTIGKDHPIHFHEEMLALEQLKSKVRNFSISVNEVLSQNFYDEQLVKDLQEAKNGIPFETDSDKLLDILTVFGILSNAYSMFLSKDTRPRRDAIEKNLLEEGTNMLKLLQSIEGDAPLIHYLIEKTNEIVSSIRSTLHHVDTVLGTISKPLLLGQEKDDNIIINLKNLPVITIEEELLTMQQDVALLQFKVDGVVSRSEPLELAYLVGMVDDLNGAYEVCEAIERSLKQKSLNDLTSCTNERKRTLRSCITKVILLKEDAVKAWNALEALAVKLQGGEFVDLVDLIATYEQAMKFMIIDTELEIKVIELITKGREADEKCQGILHIMRESNDTSLETLTPLFNEMKYCPITQHVRSALNIRYHVLNIMVNVQDIINEFPLEINSLPSLLAERIREVSKELIKWDSVTRQHYPYEASLLCGPREAFAPVEWKYQALLVLNAPSCSIPVSRGQDLLDTAKFLSENGLFKDQINDLYKILSKRIETFLHYRSEATDMFQSIQELASKSQNSGAITPSSNGDIFLRIPDLLDLSSDHCTLYLPLQSKVKMLREFFESTMLMDETTAEVKTFEGFLTWTKEGIHIVQLVEMTKQKFFEFSNQHEQSSMSSNFPRPCITLAQLADMLKMAQQQQQNHNAITYFDLPFPKSLYGFLDLLYKASSEWHQEAQVLFPLKASSRNKSRLATAGNNNKSREEIVRFLSLPAAILVTTPSHDRVMSILSEVDQLIQQLRAFIFGNKIPTVPPAITSTNKEDKEVRQTNSDIISADMREAAVLRTALDALPPSSPEVQIMNWVTAVLFWMKQSADPDLGHAQNDLNLTDAKILFAQGAQLLRNFLLLSSSPGVDSNFAVSVEKYLIDFQVLQVVMQPNSQQEELYFPSSVVFSDQVRYSLMRATDYLTFLEKQIRIAEALQHRIDQALQSDTPLAQLKVLQNNVNIETMTMVVIPDCSQLTRALQRREQKDKEIVIAPVTSKTSKSSSVASHLPIVVPKKCAAKDCDRDVKPEFVSYCSERCTVSCSKDCVLSLLKYRESLKKHYANSPSAGITAVSGGTGTANWNPRIAADINSFGFHSDAQEYFPGDDTNQKNFLATSIDGDKLKIILEKIDAKRQQQQSQKRTLSAFEQLAIRLPKVALGQGILREALEGTGGAGSIITTDDFRSKVRAALEDWLISVLQSMNYQGSVNFMAIILSKDLEEGLFYKYYDEQTDNLNRERYRAQQQLLMNNLRHSHNHHYIQKLIDREMEMEVLLGMTAQNFADEKTQQQRQELQQQQLAASRRESTENAIEAKRLAAMSNDESWRDKIGSENKPVPIVHTTLPETLPEPDGYSVLPSESSSSMNDGYNDEFDEVGDDGEIMDQEDAHQPDDGLLPIEREVLFASKNPSSPSNRVPKRPLDSNAPTMFTHESMGIAHPPKLQKVEPDSSPSPLASPMDGKSPSKPVSFLEILKKQQQASGVTPPLSTNIPKSSKVESVSTPTSPNPSREPRFRLLSRDNTQFFTITKPNGIVMKTTALVSDARLQGLIKSDFNIDGRTRIAEVERFTQELKQSNRRILGTAVFLASDANSLASSGKGDASGSYRRFCDEFTKDERAGMCTVSENVQVYLVPPSFKKSISLLKGLNLIGEQKLSSMGVGVIWAIVTAREKGPDNFTNDNVNKSFPFDVDSFVPPPAIGTTTSPSTPFVPQSLPSSLLAPSAFGAASIVGQQPRVANPTIATVPLNASAPTALTGLHQVAPQVLDIQRIRQVAEEIARSGVAALQSAQNQPNAKQTMPFLFNGNPGYTEFMSALKGAVERNKMAKANAFNMHAPNAFGGPSAFR